MARGTGTTTQQMTAAPKGSVFIWMSRHIGYPEELARKIGRGDLQIVPPSWLEEGRWQGVELTGLTVDHAVRFTIEQTAGWLKALSRVRCPTDAP